MINIHYNPVRSSVECDDPVERKEAFRLLSEALTFWVDGHVFSPSFINGVWDGKRTFFTDKGHFPSGLLAKVLQILGDEFQVEVEDYPMPHPAWENATDIKLFDNKSGYISLWDFQVSAVRRCLKFHRGVLKIATNGGKTEVLAGLLSVLDTPPSLFLIPRRDLLQQTTDRMAERLQAKVGMAGDGIWKPNTDGLTVGMFQTLNKRMDEDDWVKTWVKNTQVIMADECHFLRDERYRRVFNASRAPFRIGVSGTPWPKKNEIDKHTIIGCCGPILANVSNAELIEQGVSVKPTVLFLEPNCSFKEKMALEFNSWDYALRECHTRNKLIASLAKGFLASGRQTVIMVDKVLHGHEILQEIPEAMFAHSQSGNRNEAKKRLASGEVFCLICTRIFDTGLSVDYIEALILAGGGKSDINLLQTLGRGLRRAKDKVKDFWVVDFWDTFNKESVRHSRARYKEFQAQQAFNFVESLSEAPAELSIAAEFIAPARGRR